MCVGLHIVTSMPYSPCHSSSSGKPVTAAPPSASSGSVDHGSVRLPPQRGVDALQRREQDAEDARQRIKPSPTTMPVWGAVNSSLSRPSAMCQATSL